MQKWEYQTVSWSFVPGLGEHPGERVRHVNGVLFGEPAGRHMGVETKHGPKLHEYLSAAGREGWEAVGMIGAHQSASGGHILLKRPLP